jgi:hypothetical protein
LRVAAGADGEDPPDLPQRPPQELDVGEGAEIAGSVVPDLPRHREPRVLLLNADPDVREAGVVLEPDVVGGPVLSHQRGLEQQGLDLGVGEDGVEVDRPGHELAESRVIELAAQVVTDAVEQAPGLTDVEHLAPPSLEEVNAGKRWQIHHLFAQSAHERLQTPRRGYAKRIHYTPVRRPRQPEGLGARKAVRGEVHRTSMAGGGNP